MPILDRRHNMPKTRDGKDIYIIYTPVRDFSGYRLGVRFERGEGRTKNREKARIFDEQFGYDVMLATGAKRWKLAAPFTVAHPDFMDDPEDISVGYLDGEELGFEDEDGVTEVGGELVGA